jgi:hypothetical protein
MLKLAQIATLSVLLGLCACAGMGGTPPAPGETEQAVTARLGQPTSVYTVGEQRVLEYARGPMGQTTYMATFGPDGRLLQYEQVLTDAKFGTIKVNRSTRDEVLHTLGRPAEVSQLPLRELEVWSYRYKESGVWNSMMHVHFDRDGVVRQLMNGPDPMYEERRGMFR